MEISQEQIIESVAIGIATAILQLKAGEIKEVSSKLLCPEKWDKIMKSVGISNREPIESNGWE